MVLVTEGEELERRATIRVLKTEGRGGAVKDLAPGKSDLVQVGRSLF